MKGLFVFVALVLGYSMLNMVHLKVGASTYKDGINAYMKQVEHNTHRAPAIEIKK